MSDTRVDDWFGRTLAELKEAGCNLLVTGSFPSGSLDEVSARLLGRKPGRRARVVGLFGRDVSAGRRRLGLVPHGLEPAILVNTTEAPRSAAIAETSPDSPVDVRTIGRNFDVFLAELRTAIDEARRHRGPLDPGQLRIGVDSLRAVLDETGRADVETLVDRVARDVRGAGGIAHFVYDSAKTGSRPAWLDPLFDAVVEHRLREEDIEQRWRFPDRGRETRWFPVE